MRGGGGAPACTRRRKRARAAFSSLIPEVFGDGDPPADEELLVRRRATSALAGRADDEEGRRVRPPPLIVYMRPTALTKDDRSLTLDGPCTRCLRVSQRMHWQCRRRLTAGTGRPPVLITWRSSRSSSSAKRQQTRKSTTAAAKRSWQVVGTEFAGAATVPVLPGSKVRWQRNAWLCVEATPGILPTILYHLVAGVAAAGAGCMGSMTAAAKSAADLSRATGCCRHWRAAISDEVEWRELCKCVPLAALLKARPLAWPGCQLSWRQLFVQRVIASTNPRPALMWYGGAHAFPPTSPENYLLGLEISQRLLEPTETASAAVEPLCAELSELSSAIQLFDDDEIEDNARVMIQVKAQPVSTALSKQRPNHELCLSFYAVRKTDGKCLCLLQTAALLAPHTDQTVQTTVNHLAVEGSFARKLNTTFKVCVIDHKAPHDGCTCVTATPFRCTCGKGHVFKIKNVTIAVYNDEGAPGEIKTMHRLLQALETRKFARCWA